MKDLKSASLLQCSSSIIHKYIDSDSAYFEKGSHINGRGMGKLLNFFVTFYVDCVAHALIYSVGS